MNQSSNQAKPVTQYTQFKLHKRGSHQKTPQSTGINIQFKLLEKQMRKVINRAMISSPLDNYNQMKGYSPQTFYKQPRITNSPNTFKNFQFQNVGNLPKPKLVGNSQNDQTALNISNLNNSTKDNTKISIAQQNPNTSTSTIGGIQNAYNSNITIDKKILDSSFLNENSGQRNKTHKPPIIPSLSGKIQQTQNLNAQLISGKSGYQALSMLTGLTTDDKINEFNSRMQAQGGFQQNNIMTAVSETLILSNDVQNIVNYRIVEDSKSKQFFDAQSPFYFLERGQPNSYQNYINSRKRMVRIDELNNIDIFKYQ